MRSPENHRSRAAAIALIGILASIAAVGCGDREDEVDEPESQSPAEPKAARDELVQLRPKSIPRPARALRVDDVAAVSRIESGARGRPTAADREAAKLNAGTDGDTEHLSGLASEQLNRVFGPVDADGRDLDGVVAPGFRCAPLRPSGMRPVSRSGDVVVLRSSEHAAREATIVGARGLAASIGTFRDGMDATRVVVGIKSFAIEMLPSPEGAFLSRILLEVSGPLSDGLGSRQVNAIWTCTWVRAPAGSNGLPRLTGIRVDEHEEVTLTRRSTQTSFLFADATVATLGGTPSFETQVLRGIEYWAERVTRLGDMHLTGHHGLAVGDVNGDGLEDLYVCDGGSLPNRLYVQNPDASVDEVASASGVDWLEDSRSALLIDLDNDGDQDLVVATIATIVIAENDGSGKFSVRGGHMGARYPFSMSAADYDSDGDLDIYVCVYAGGGDVSGARGVEARSPIPFDDARNGGRNMLLENFGEFCFADVTDEVGMGGSNSRWSFAAAWEDYDRDGDPDLYVANDFGGNSFFRNDSLPDGRRKFVDVASEAGVEDIAAGMSVAWGDFNRDGRADLYVGNMFSSAGARISHQQGFAPGRSKAAIAGLRRMARGNSLFARRADSAGFDDVSTAAGVTMGRWAWSSGFIDIDNDGWQDIVVANGFLTSSSTVDL